MLAFTCVRLQNAILFLHIDIYTYFTSSYASITTFFNDKLYRPLWMCCHSPNMHSMSPMFRDNTENRLRDWRILHKIYFKIPEKHLWYSILRIFYDDRVIRQKKLYHFITAFEKKNLKMNTLQTLLVIFQRRYKATNLGVC